MKFELTFDKEIYNKQMDLLFDLAWRRKISYFKNSQYLGLALIFIGAAMFYDRPSLFGGLFLFLGLSNLVPFIYYYFKIKTIYKKFENVKTDEIKSYVSFKEIHWEFAEKSLIQHVENNLKITDWTEFAHFFIKENNLVMITKDYHPWVLAENEVGKENFQKIILFVEKKIKIV